MDTRNQNPTPTSWEIPAAIAACVLVIAFLALPVGQGLAEVVSGHGFRWPTVVSRVGVHPVLSAGLQLLRGHPGRNLSPADHSGMPATWLVYLTIGILQALLIAAATGGLIAWYRFLGPGGGRGMASRREATAVLGPGRLLEHADILRPDLRTHTRRTSTDLRSWSTRS
ncbi:MAG: hypothetical protein ABI140_06435 [Jatrophihabitantaceae bacterium]